MNDASGNPMHGPKWKWEWSPNTIALLIGFVGLAIAWGYGLATFSSRTDTVEKGVVEIRAEVKRIDETDRTLDSHEIRLTAVERRAGEVSSDMRSVELAINQLGSDMRLTREILERLEKSFANGR